VRAFEHVFNWVLVTFDREEHAQILFDDWIGFLSDTHVGVVVDWVVQDELQLHILGRVSDDFIVVVELERGAWDVVQGHGFFVFGPEVVADFVFPNVNSEQIIGDHCRGFLVLNLHYEFRQFDQDFPRPLHSCIVNEHCAETQRVFAFAFDVQILLNAYNQFNVFNRRFEP